jgi:phage gp36-like protein
LPLEVIPESIRDMSTKLACYFLYKRTLTLTLPDVVKEDYSEVNRLLQKIQTGNFNPFPVQKNPFFVQTNKVFPYAGSVSTQTNNCGKY